MCAFTTADSSEIYFTCRKCGTQLFEGKDIETHFLGSGNFKKKREKTSGDAKKCNSWFVGERVASWMPEMVEVEGKFSCPKCSCRVGHYNWSGSQCSCGQWIAPAMMFPKARVDIKSRGGHAVVAAAAAPLDPDAAPSVAAQVDPIRETQVSSDSVANSATVEPPAVPLES
mmetsp:Transcript_19266/g.45044  ORF Transcript_19266/g.45044 Transcript_19266/m.45044 type:complete len:171 (-) Transcript_19266:86-598(-)